MVRDDEKRFLVMIADKPDGVSVRNLIQSEDFPIHHKRAWYLLEKWSDRGWYDYGVNLELGWLWDEGKAQAEKWRAELEEESDGKQA